MGFPMICPRNPHEIQAKSTNNTPPGGCLSPIFRASAAASRAGRTAWSSVSKKNFEHRTYLWDLSIVGIYSWYL